MKKILFILLILVIKLSAYEYLIYNNNNPSLSVGQFKNIFYKDNNGNLVYYFIRADNSTGFSSSDGNFYSSLYQIKIKENYVDSGYISKSMFIDYCKNDLEFLNDLYEQRTNPFLNFLYNDNSFNGSNHVVYTNYEILYNSDGLAVESKIDGVYAGLYENDEIGQSGNLYNADGSLVLVDGKEATFIQKFGDKILGPVKDAFMQSQGIHVLSDLMKVVMVMTLLVFVIILARRVIGGRANSRVD